MPRTALFDDARDPPIQFLVRGSTVAMLTRLIGAALSYVAAILISRILGAKGYGICSIALAWALLLVIPCRAGLDTAALKFAPIYLDRGDRARLNGFVRFAVATTFGLSMLAGGLVYGAFQAQLIDGPAAMGAATGITIFPIAGLSLVGAMLRVERRIFASQFYEQILRPGLLIAFLLAGMLVLHAMSASIAMSVVALSAFGALLAGGFHAWRSLPVRGGPADHSPWRNWLSLSGIFLAMTVVQEALNHIDVVMLGYLAGAREAGLFAAAWRVAALVSVAVAALTTVSGPLIALHFDRREFGSLTRIARSTARIGFVAAAVASLTLVVAGRPILQLFGPEFSAAYPALLWLLAGGIANAFTGSVAYLMTMTGRHKHALLIFLGALVISIGLNVALIPRFSIVGAAVASATATVFWNVAMLIYVRRSLGIDASALALPSRSR